MKFHAQALQQFSAKRDAREELSPAAMLKGSLGKDVKRLLELSRPERWVMVIGFLCLVVSTG